MEKKLLISNDKIIKRIKEIGKEINEKYKGEKLTLLCILKGSIYFFSDLSREIDLDVELEFIRVSSYAGCSSTGKVELKFGLDNSIKDKNVIIVEDIVDTGRTLDYLLKDLRKQKPKSLETCSLLDKPDKRVVKDLVIDYVGFTIPDYFVFGYGLDVDQMYRNLSSIYYFNNK